MNVLDILKQLPDWLQIVIAILGAVSSLSVALQAPLMLVSKLTGWAGASWLANEAGSIGAHLGQIASQAQRLLASIASTLGKPPSPPKATILVFALGAGVVATVPADEGCKPGQAANDVSIALSTENTVCITAAAALPLLGLPPKTVEQIMSDCNIAVGATQLVQQVVDQFDQQTAPSQAVAKAQAQARADGVCAKRR